MDSVHRHTVTINRLIPSVRRATPARPSFALRLPPSFRLPPADECEDLCIRSMLSVCDVLRESDARSGAISAGIIGSTGAMVRVFVHKARSSHTRTHSLFLLFKS